jgi:hypothetical protein
MMKDHGDWVLYKPDSLPRDAPPNTMFARRVSDGADWYEYIRSGAFEPNTVKLLIANEEGADMVRVPVVEVDRAFPAGCRILEMTDTHRLQDEVALIEEFGSRMFDLKTGRIGGPRQFKLPVNNIQQELDDLRQRIEKLERKI